jgi:hypothetical protein
MQTQIANPIYDVVFKFMMEDNAVAKLFISSIINEEVVELTPKPQEYTTDNKVYVGENPSITIYRLDFSARVKTPEGERLIIIEMQKASVPADIIRFRNYLGNQYANPNNSIALAEKVVEPLEIYAIYFLGEGLGIRDTPVISVFPDVRDLATNEVIEGKNKFISLVTHRCWVVQVNCLKKRRRTELEMLLSVFDQENRTQDHHILNVREEDFPEKYRPLIRRLKMAASNREVKQKMNFEDAQMQYLRNITYSSKAEGRVEGRAEGLVEGRAEGLVEGRAEGLVEGEAKGEVKSLEKAVINGHQKGYTIEDISNFTGLSHEEIIRILKRHGLL